MPLRFLFAFISLLILITLDTAAQKKLKTENVILITLDGFRWRELFTGADKNLIRDKN